jgi:RNAse (barnase) inhibitor barstar
MDNGVNTVHVLDEIIDEYDRLIESIEFYMRTNQFRTNIKTTRLAKIRQDLSNWTDLASGDKCSLLEIVLKLNQINFVFDNDIEFNKDDVKRLIEGKYDLCSDESLKFHDYAFEFVMAVRFFRSFKSDKKSFVNMNGIWDVLVNDSLVIECKNIRSKKNFRKNVETAKSQIEDRVNREGFSDGIIALDISNVLDRDVVSEFVQAVFERFSENYKMIGSCQSKGIGNIGDIYRDKNFKSIVASFIAHEAEAFVYSEIPLEIDLGENVKAIFWQVYKVINIKGFPTPLPVRASSYLINRKLEEEEYMEVARMLGSLAVGF